MPRPPRSRPLEDVAAILEGLLGARLVRATRGSLEGRSPDLLLEGAGVAFMVEWKAVGNAANVGSAVRELKALEGVNRAGRRVRAVVSIVAVPFMGETGRRLCAEAGVSWVDLSGNAWIDAPGKQIRFVGHKNRFASAGRPADVFAARSSRVVRALLMEPERAFSQAELAEVSGLDKGRVSRLVRRLGGMDLVVREGRTLRMKDPSLALEAWREAYDFEKHAIKRGHVAVREPEELISMIRDSAGSFGVSWALTGLAAAWQMTHFAMFRLVTVFVRERPSEEWLGQVGFREEPRGANLWVVRPVDDGVFVGAGSVDGLPCVHPLQAYLDLKAQPERAADAAVELRKRLIQGGAA